MDNKKPLKVVAVALSIDALILLYFAGVFIEIGRPINWFAAIVSLIGMFVAMECLYVVLRRIKYGNDQDH